MRDIRNTFNRISGKFVCAAIAAAVMGLASQACAAQDWAKAMLAKSPRHGEYVVIKEANGRDLQAFVVYPEVKEKAPVIVLIHEIFGESDWFKEMADELAGAGYIVVAPDLLSGFGPAPKAGEMQMPGQKPMMMNVAMDDSHMDHGDMQMQGAAGAAFVPMNPGGTTAFADQQSITRAVSGLDATIVNADLDAAADYGKKLPAANGKLFVAGFCWGGSKSFLYATHRHDLSAAFVFYGTPPPADAMKSITAPVYGFYAGNDARVSATIPQAQTDMKTADKIYDPVTYDGAGHGFMRAGQQPDATPANVTAWNEGFKRLVDLLGRNSK